MARPRRRGSNTIEFALILPVFLALIGVIFEYGFYFYMRSVVSRTVLDGCRAGAVIPPNESPDPESTAENTMMQAMASYNFMGIDCSGTDDSRCDMNVQFSGASPSEVLSCDMTIDYGGITGAVPVPDTINYASFAMLEVQR